MYQASDAFHKAVQNGAPQKALLIFPDLAFTNDDIDVERGIELNEFFSTDHDLAIGQAISNEIVFSLINPEGLLNEYAFGEFTATIGARILDEPVNGRFVCKAISGGNTWVGARVAPYLTRNGAAVSSQPSHPVTAILIHNGKAYCFGNGNATVYNSSGSIVNESVSAFMKRKAELYWNGCGFAWDPSARILDEWKNYRHRRYEFVPLGIFKAERPDVPTVRRIDLTCYDRMMNFDGDMPGASELGITYPTTIGALLTALCTKYNVPKRASGFINESGEIEEEPEDFKNATVRTVIAWIAEAAATNARIDRDGYLVMDWYRTTGLSMDEHDYSDFNPKWFETEAVGALYNRDTREGEDAVRGSGSGAYLIQDNPLLRGST